ncbi:MAG TPA: Flp pilus assembly complex ATPase component TadA [Firmicutes bacterium]|nr:Flp pilus assembly complex ATPase component TadA [Bacillota bacterium]
MGNGKRYRLGELLVELGVIDQGQLNRALEVQRKTGERLGTVLVRLGYARQDDILRVLETQLDIPRVDIDRYVVSPEVIGLVPESLARRHKVFPVELRDGALTLAMADPLDVFAIDDVRIAAGYDIRPVIAAEGQILDAIAKYYGSKESIEDIVKVIEDVEVTAGAFGDDADGGDDIATDKLRQMIDEAPVVRLVNTIIAQGIRERASDIHIEPQERNVRIRYRVDGVLRDVLQAPRRLQAAIASRIKIMANIDIAERRMPQDGRVQLRVEGEDVDLRVSTLPTIYGEKVVARVQRTRGSMPTIEELGFSATSARLLRSATSRPYGMILVTGPTGSGKTLTLYALLAELNSVEKNIVTVEDPVEFRLPGINQVQTNPRTGLTFAAGLRAILRQDPDVVMVGEIRDRETADIAIRFALTGHLVLSTLHTNDAASALVRLVEMGIEPFLVASSVSLVAGQRLVRLICPQCKERYDPGREIWERWAEFISPEYAAPGHTAPGDMVPGDAADAIFYRGRGCPHCGNTGYYGRTAIEEIMSVNEAIRGLLVRGATAEEIRRAAVASGMKSMAFAGARKVMEGATTPEEVMRVCTGGGE